MDADFFSELEQSISNVGASEIWERVIGGRKVLLSPISFEGQAKVTEVLNNSASNNNIINESKRVTLSHAIVGIDNYDLREYRTGKYVFGPIQIGTKNVKVDLPTYLYHKMVAWGQQFLDDVFSVYADLMESHSRQNVDQISFQNAKGPHEELADLMIKVAELRTQLELPQLVEQQDKKSNLQEFPEDSEIGDKKEPEEESFDPFRAIPTERPTIPTTQTFELVQPPKAVLPEVAAPKVPADVPTKPTQPSRSRAIAETELELSPLPKFSEGTIQNPHTVIPSVSSEVIEPTDRVRAPVSAPVINPQKFGKNPRFNPPKA